MISNKCFYALKAMLELAGRGDRRPVTIGQIAEARDIPVRFLEAIMRQLKQAGLADSVRGKEGGYVLAKPASKISVGHVIRIVEGPLFQASDKSHSLDVFRDVWKSAEAALSGVLDRTTFSELVEKERNQQLAEAASYSI
jgi:Rrf2 family protein